MTRDEWADRLSRRLKSVERELKLCTSFLSSTALAEVRQHEIHEPLEKPGPGRDLRRAKETAEAAAEELSAVRDLVDARLLEDRFEPPILQLLGREISQTIHSLQFWVAATALVAGWVLLVMLVIWIVI